MYLDFLKQDEVSERLKRVMQAGVSQALSRVSARVAKALGVQTLGSKEFAVVPNHVMPLVSETISEKQHRASLPAGDRSDYFISDADFEKIADKIFPTQHSRSIYQEARLRGVSGAETAKKFGTTAQGVFRITSQFDKEIRRHLGIAATRPIVGKVRTDVVRQVVPADFVVISQEDFDRAMGTVTSRLKLVPPARRRRIMRMHLLEKMSPEAIAGLLKVSVAAVNQDITLGLKNIANSIGVPHVVARRLLVVPDAIRMQYVDNGQ